MPRHRAGRLLRVEARHHPPGGDHHHPPGEDHHHLQAEVHHPLIGLHLLLLEDRLLLNGRRPRPLEVRLLAVGALLQVVEVLRQAAEDHLHHLNGHLLQVDEDLHQVVEGHQLAGEVPHQVGVDHPRVGEDLLLVGVGLPLAEEDHHREAEARLLVVDLHLAADRQEEQQRQCVVGHS